MDDLDAFFRRFVDAELLAFDIVLICLGCVFLLLTVVLLTIGALLLRSRRRRARVRRTSAAALSVGENKDVKETSPVDAEAANGGVSTTVAAPEKDTNHNHLSVRRAHRPNCIQIPTLAEIRSDEEQKCTKTKIRIEDFTRRVKAIHDADNQQLVEEFEILNKRGLNPDRKSVASEEHMKRNRFMDVLPFDDNRVRIAMNNLDYINASFIDGYTGPKAYIASQGPIGTNELNQGRRESTVADFWAMVWEQGVHCVIMLTQVIENLRPKCASYWPEELNQVVTHGQISVRLVSTTDDHLCMHREFDIQKEGEPVRQVSQFHFKDWQDSKAPDSCSNLLEFVRRIRAKHYPSPIVVHCSAGVGRTGVYIALDILLQMLEGAAPGSHIDVFECVRRLREQRIRMVQTLEQYITLYDTLALAVTELGYSVADTTHYAQRVEVTDEVMADVENKTP